MSVGRDAELPKPPAGFSWTRRMTRLPLCQIPVMRVATSPETSPMAILIEVSASIVTACRLARPSHATIDRCSTIDPNLPPVRTAVAKPECKCCDSDFPKKSKLPKCFRTLVCSGVHLAAGATRYWRVDIYKAQPSGRATGVRISTLSFLRCSASLTVQVMR